MEKKCVQARVRHLLRSIYTCSSDQVSDFMRANNLIVLVEFLLKFPSKKTISNQLFLV